TRDPISTQHRWTILQRDAFTCQWCGARPGNEDLHVAHMFPHSRGGTEHDNNLTTACRRCNNGMGVRVAVPERLCTGEHDRSGWIVWQRWGKWVLSFMSEPCSEDIDNPLVDTASDIALTFEPLDYWIALERVHEPDWHDHLQGKPWMRCERDEEPDPYYDKRN